MANGTLSNLTECGWPQRNSVYVYQSSGFKYTELTLHPIWLFVCTIGNILNIILLRKIHTFQATFIIALAYFDMLTMWGWLIRSIQVYVGYTTIGGIPNRHLTGIETQPLHVFLVVCEYTGNIASWYSDWIIVAFSIIRLLFIMDPLKRRAEFTRKRILIGILCFLPLPCVFALYPVVEYATRNNPTAIASWVGSWRQAMYMGGAVDALVSFLAILITNMVVAMFFLKRHVRRMRGFNTSNHDTNETCEHSEEPTGLRSHGNDATISTTMALMTASVIVYLVTTIPYMTWYSLQALERRCKVYINDDQFAILQSVFLQFMYAKYSVNFFVYCGASRTFCKRFVALITRCQCSCSAKHRTAVLPSAASSSVSGGRRGTDVTVVSANSNSSNQRNIVAGVY